MGTPLRGRLVVATGATVVLVFLWMACQNSDASTNSSPEATAVTRPATADDRKSMMRIPIDEALASAEKLGYVCRRGGLVHDVTPRGNTTFECRTCQLTIEAREKAWTLNLAARDGVVEQLGASEYDLAIANIASHSVGACSALLREMQAQPPS